MISLQTMRDHKRLKWPIRIGFGLVIISFIFFYGWNRSSFNQPGQVTEFARLDADSWNPFRRSITIGPELAAEAHQQLAQEKASLIPQINEHQAESLETPLELRQQSANIVLTHREAQRLGVHFDFGDIRNMLAAQRMTQEELEFIAAQAGMTPRQYVHHLARVLTQDMTRVLMAQAAHVSLFELWQEYRLAYDKIEMDVAAYPVDAFQEQVSVTDDELAEYLAEHVDEFRVPATRVYAYVKLSRDDMRAQIQPTDEDLRVYYEQNMATYQQQAGVRTEELTIPLGLDLATTRAERALEVLAEVRERAAASDDWTTLANTLRTEYDEFSFYASPASWVTASSTYYSPEYLEATRTLADDEVSTPILDNARAVLIRIVERRDAGVRPYDDVRDQVESDYIASRLNELQSERLREWRMLVTGKDIVQFAAAVGLNDELSSPTSVNAPSIPGVGDFTSQQDRYYIQNLTPGELSDPIRVTDGIVVLEVRSETESYTPSLAEVRDEVEEAVRRRRAIDEARRVAEQNLEIVRGGADFQTALADAPTTPFRPAPFTRTETVEVLNAPLINFRQEYAGLAVGMTGISPYGNDPDQPLGYAVWRVVSITEPEREQFAEDRLYFSNQFLELQMRTMIEEWLADRRAEARFEPLNMPEDDDDVSGS